MLYMAFTKLFYMLGVLNLRYNSAIINFKVNDLILTLFKKMYFLCYKGRHNDLWDHMTSPVYQELFVHSPYYIYADK